MDDPRQVSLADIERAERLLRPYFSPSPLVCVAGHALWLKCDNRLPTGSFKLRGALAAIHSQGSGSLERGVVAASAGNHGLGVAFAARARNVAALIVVPAGATAVKVDGIRAMGAEVLLVDGGYAEAETQAKRLAARSGAMWISPYNDANVIAGQGTMALELVAQWVNRPGHRLREAYVPVGGGGLIAGTAIVLKALMPEVRLMGAQPRNSCFMALAFAGEDRKIVRESPTLADGLAGDFEDEALTLAYIRSLIDGFVLVEEDEIVGSMRWAWREAGEVIEPSAAVALAAWRACGQGEAAVFLTGRNADRALLSRLGIQDRTP
jgi:threonine dehydratase